MWGVFVLSDYLFIKIIHVYSIHLVLKVSNLLAKVFFSLL